MVMWFQEMCTCHKLSQHTIMTNVLRVSARPTRTCFFLIQHMVLLLALFGSSTFPSSSMLVCSYFTPCFPPPSLLLIRLQIQPLCVPAVKSAELLMLGISSMCSRGQLCRASPFLVPPHHTHPQNSPIAFWVAVGLSVPRVEFFLRDLGAVGSFPA